MAGRLSQSWNEIWTGWKTKGCFVKGSEVVTFVFVPHWNKIKTFVIFFLGRE